MAKKILMIDDQPDFGDMVKVNLEEGGRYEVDTALNAIDGLQLIDQNKYDVIFLDILMPKMEGHVALGEIKKKVDTPVVMMSAYVPPHKKDEILRAGACALLEKPVKLDAIIETIEKVTEAN